mgnify:CR=1 FL=1
MSLPFLISSGREWIYSEKLGLYKISVDRFFLTPLLMFNNSPVMEYRVLVVMNVFIIISSSL